MSTSIISRDDASGRVPAGGAGAVRKTAVVRNSAAVRMVDGVRAMGDGREPGLADASRNLLREGRPADWRRPRSAPSGDAGTAARVSRASHQPPQAPALSNGWVIAIAAAVLVVVGGAAVGVRGMGVVDTSTTVAVVQVEAGDTLGSIAAANAPGLAVGDVVGQIRAMNGLPGTRVQVGQTLRVPVTAGR